VGLPSHRGEGAGGVFGRHGKQWCVAEENVVAATVDQGVVCIEALSSSR